MRALIEGSPAENDLALTLSAGERWYVLRSRPHREMVATRHLENQDYRVFLPRFMKTRRHARKFETVSAPLFPGYLFIILDLMRDRWRSVNGTFGVDRILMRTGVPEPVPHGFVEQLLGATEADGVTHPNAGLEQGRAIRVTAGPFADLVGTLQRLDEAGRARVLLDLLGGKVPVLLSESSVAPTTL